MKKRILPLLTGVVMTMAACTNDVIESTATQPEASTAKTDVVFTARGFIPAGAVQSRTAITPGADGATFAWVEENDTIGILPDSGAQVYFVINDLDDDDAGKATFTGGAWGLKPTNDYTAYYPFIQDIMLKRTEVPVDYSLQSYKHRTNEQGNLVVCPSHDYMSARSEQPSSDCLNFQFSHLGALVEVQFTLPEAADVKSFRLTADEAIFPVKGTFDLTADEVAITPDNENLSRFLLVNVEDLATTEAGQTVSVFFMMPPMDITDHSLKATVTYGDNNTSLPFEIDKAKLDGSEGVYTQFEAGKYYTLQTEEYENQPDVIHVMDNYAFLSDVKEAMQTKHITKLRFVSGSTLVSEAEIYSDGETVAYAVENGDWMEVHTIAKEFALRYSLSGYFTGWDFLTELDLSSFNTSAVTNMREVFRGCSSLVSLDLSGFDTSNVTDMVYMFYGCSSLTSLNLNGFDTSAVTDMSYMFFSCSTLASLDLSCFNTSAVTDMKHMFGYCSSLASLDLSGFDTSNVTIMNGMFRSCSSLTSLDLSGFNTSAVTDMFHMFNLCTALVSLDLSGFSYDANPVCSYMFDKTGQNVEEKPINIYVSEAGKSYLDELPTMINSEYATLVVKP